MESKKRERIINKKLTDFKETKQSVINNNVKNIPKAKKRKIAKDDIKQQHIWIHTPIFPMEKN